MFSLQVVNKCYSRQGSGRAILIPQDFIEGILVSIISILPHLIVLDFTKPIIFDEEYKFRASPLCSLHQTPVMSSLLGPNKLI
jgi:hypothetical protein